MDWFLSHGFQLIESTGIIAGLFFTGFALRADLRGRRLEILMRLTENHRAIWNRHDGNLRLRRIFHRNPDISAKPVTPHEARFVQYLINHIAVTFRAQKLGLYQAPERLEMDLRELFSYPVPRAVWEKVRRYQDRDFEDFMTRLLEGIFPTSS
jgi:hypothetical protein